MENSAIAKKDSLLIDAIGLNVLRVYEAKLRIYLYSFSKIRMFMHIRFI